MVYRDAGRSADRPDRDAGREAEPAADQRGLGAHRRPEHAVQPAGPELLDTARAGSQPADQANGRDQGEQEGVEVGHHARLPALLPAAVAELPPRIAAVVMVDVVVAA